MKIEEETEKKGEEIKKKKKKTDKIRRISGHFDLH